MAELIFSWRDISVSVPIVKSGFFRSVKEEKVLLHKASGRAESGSLVAIIGPSGAGKTTLLTVLAGKTKKFTGTLQLNSQKITSSEMREASGFVFQHFVATETLSVKEHLTFMSALTCKLERKERQNFVKKLIKEISLEHCSNSLIRNLSGGEIKKLALAVQLINNPQILFIDEPTTGLDSSTAIATVELLRAEVAVGKLIILTVNQPSSQLYNCFDQIILMGFGKTIFQGSRQEIKEFFDGFGLICPRSFNPPEFYIHCVLDLRNNKEGLDQLQLQGLTFMEKYNTVKNGIGKNGLQIKHLRQRKKLQLHFELMWLLWRLYIDAIRNIKRHLIELGIIMFVAVTIITLFSGIYYEQATAAKNYNGLLYFVIPQIMFPTQYACISVFMEEYSVYVQEQSAYSSFSYFTSEVFAVVPRVFINVLNYLVPMFIFISFPGGVNQFIIMFIILLVGGICSGTFGLCLSAHFKTMASIYMITVPLDVVAMILAGIYMKTATVPTFIAWLKYVTPFNYIFESLTILQWSEVSYIECLEAFNITCHRNGTDVLRDLGYPADPMKIYWNTSSLMILLAVWYLLGYIGVMCRYSR